MPKFKVTILIVILFISGTSSFAQASDALFCTRAEREILHSHNAEIPWRDYSQTNNRTLKEYYVEKEEYTDKVVIDGGAGWAVAGLEMSRKAKKVIAINTQPMHEAIVTLSKMSLPEISNVITPDFINDIKFLTWKQLERAIARYYSPRFPSPKIISTISKKYMELVKSGKFSYLLGYTEEILSKHDLKADFIIDWWGSFAYSHHRVLLLELYYRALNPGGHAKIIFDNVIMGTWITVGNSRMPLSLYLTKKFPHIFTVEKVTINSSFLIMKKSTDSLDLGLTKVSSQEVKRSENGWHVPEATYSLLR